MSIDSREIKINRSVDDQELKETSISKWWKIFKFTGDPPISGSIEEKRLEDKCREYIKAVLDPKFFTPIGEKYRRNLHKELAIMLTREEYDNIDNQILENISDFTSFIITGFSLEQALDDFDKSRK